MFLIRRGRVFEDCVDIQVIGGETDGNLKSPARSVKGNISYAAWLSSP